MRVLLLAIGLFIVFSCTQRRIETPKKQLKKLSLKTEKSNQTIVQRSLTERLAQRQMYSIEENMLMERLMQIEEYIPDQSESGKQVKALHNDPKREGDLADETATVDLPLPRPYDSRFEIACLNVLIPEHKAVLANSKGVMGIVSTAQLESFNGGTMVRGTVTLGERFGLCPEEPFFNQPVVCTGTAFLVAPKFVLTAYHNVKQIPLKQMRFIIGYKMISCEGAESNLLFSKKEIASALSLVKSDLLKQLDLALIEVEEPVDESIALPLILEKNFLSEYDHSVYAIGYPMGLPQKFITNASVREKETNLSFYTTLDTYQGNSGSPVFDADTHQVVGVLVGGGIDFKSSGNCLLSNLCADRMCKGERVVNISSLHDEIAGLINSNSQRSLLSQGLGIK